MLADAVPVPVSDPDPAPCQPHRLAIWSRRKTMRVSRKTVPITVLPVIQKNRKWLPYVYSCVYTRMDRRGHQHLMMFACHPSWTSSPYTKHPPTLIITMNLLLYPQPTLHRERCR